MFKMKPDFADDELPELPSNPFELLRVPRLRRQFWHTAISNVAMIGVLVLSSHYTDTTGLVFLVVALVPLAATLSALELALGFGIGVGQAMSWCKTQILKAQADHEARG